MLLQDNVLVMETDSGSKSSDFIEENTEESPTERCSSNYDTYSGIDLGNSGYEIAINPVNKALPFDDADENNFVWTLLVLNEPGDFDFDGSEGGTKYIGNCKEADRFFI